MERKIPFPVNFWQNLTVILLLVVTLYGLQYGIRKKYQPELRVKRGLEVLQLAEFQCSKATKSLLKFSTQKKEIKWQALDSLSSVFQCNAIILKKNKPVFWNNNRFPMEKIKSIPSGNARIIFFEAKPQLFLKRNKADITVITFLPLEKKLAHEGIILEKGLKNEGFPQKRWSVTFRMNNRSYPKGTLYLIFFIYLFIWVGFIITGLQLYEKSREKLPKFLANHKSGFIILVIIITRVIQMFIGLPSILSHSSWLTQKIIHFPGAINTANILINSVFLSLVILLLTKEIKAGKTPTKRLKWPSILILQLVFLIISLGIYFITENLVENGGLAIPIPNLFFSAKGLGIAVILIITNFIIYLWAYLFVQYYKHNKTAFRLIIINTVVAAVVLLPTVLKTGIHIYAISMTLSLILLFIIWYIHRETKPYQHAIYALFVLSLAASVLFNETHEKAKEAKQRYLAYMLTQKKDPYLEYLIKNKAKEILQDTIIDKILESNSAEATITTYLNKNYFDGFLKAYSKQITLCEPGQTLEIRPENRIVECDTYFNELHGEKIIKTKNFSLSLIQNTGESIYYLARFEWAGANKKERPKHLYVEFFRDRIPKGLGYPELIQSNNEENLHLSGYSLAYYLNGKLEYKFGDFPYPIDFSVFKRTPERKIIKKLGYNHIILPIGNHEKLMVSRPAETLSDKVLPFSILFMLSSFVLLVFVSAFYAKTIKQTFIQSFTTRLQMGIFTTMALIFGLLTIVILYYFNTNSKQNISSNLKEKSHSISIELRNKTSEGGIRSENKEEFQAYLQKLALTFFTDINVYDTNGWLMATSRPEIFTKGLQSKLMNPQAYVQIRQKHSLFYLGKEKIKDVSFFSSYAPFIDNSGMETGILNLPYFARETEWQHAYYEMQSNLINLFVLIGLAGLLLIIYLSRILTKPMKLLQQKLNLVSIEKTNEKIKWKRQDEIGQLIQAYNQMVEKLEESTKLLKDSEREEAWREMARQIAHEIRNPLTPMKLNLQYLQKVYASKDPSFDEKFKSVSVALIDQIETLNEVVGMFYDFSKSKQNYSDKADLNEVVASVTTLFKKSYNIHFEITKPSENIKLSISPQDLFRILNNLLKNAVQSMEKQEHKEVKIKITKEENRAKISISDNGAGIGEEDADKIFKPYFTTKSKGSGLGLAIVKNLITEAGGSIYFEKNGTKGTTFIFYIPLA